MKKLIANKIQINKYLNRAGEPVENKRHVITDNVKLTLELRCRNWYTRFRVEGKQTNVSLRTSDLKTAAARAVDQAEAALNGNWGAVKVSQGKRISIGEIISIFESSPKVEVSQDTRQGYVYQLRHVVRTGLGLKKDADVDALSSNVLTGKLLEDFQGKIVPRELPEGLQRERAKRTANASRASARGLFSEVILEKKLYPNLADLESFLKVRKLKETPVQYDFAASELWIEEVKRNLPARKLSDPVSHLLIRLCLSTGLRRAEALNARKSWISKDRSGNWQIRVQPTEDWLPKGRRARKIPLPADVRDEIFELSDGEYVIPALEATRSSNREIINDDVLHALFDGGKLLATRHELVKALRAKTGVGKATAYDALNVNGRFGEHLTENNGLLSWSGGKVIDVADLEEYEATGPKRLQRLGRRTTSWFQSLRIGKKSWPFKKKLHELRKWFGAQVACQAGLFEAQRLLGHSDPQTTSDYYAALNSTPEYTLDLAAPTNIRKAS